MSASCLLSQSSPPEHSTHLTTTFYNIIFFIFTVQSLNFWSSFSLFLKSACEIRISLYICIFLSDFLSEISGPNKSNGRNCIMSLILSQECSGRFSYFFSPLALSINILNPLERFRLVYFSK